MGIPDLGMEKTSQVKDSVSNDDSSVVVVVVRLMEARTEEEEEARVREGNGYEGIIEANNGEKQEEAVAKKKLQKEAIIIELRLEMMKIIYVGR